MIEKGSLLLAEAEGKGFEIKAAAELLQGFSVTVWAP